MKRLIALTATANTASLMPMIRCSSEAWRSGRSRIQAIVAANRATTPATSAVR